jgi:hypothetical protein
MEQTIYAASLVNLTGLTTMGSSFSGLFARVYTGHMRITFAG